MITKLKLLFLLLIFSLPSCGEEDKASTECMNKCNQVPDAGSCFAAFRRFYFDKTTMTCDTFIWGGCNGVVPFETMEECLSCGCK